MARGKRPRGRPHPTASRSIYNGRIVNLRVDDVELSPGHTVRREVVEHPGSVVVVAEDGRGRILWERQYRYAINKTLYELPAGTLDRDEAPDACASRELEEETGYRPATLLSLGGFYAAPGFCTEYLHAFLARDLARARVNLDEDEEIEVVPLTVEETLQKIDAGEIEDAKSLAAFYLYLRRQNLG